MPELLVRIGGTNDPFTTAIGNRLQPPGGDNLFGTDSLGRDHFARTMLATGLSLRVAGRAFVLAFVLALLLGSIAGLCKGRWPDRLITYIISVIHTVPFILLAVALAAVLQASLEVIYLIVGGIAWAPPARIVRAEVARMRGARFVIAERAYGVPPVTIFLRSILPTAVLAPFISLLYLLPELVGLDVGLSYFGLGAQPPTPTLGRLIFDGLGYLRTAWWISLLPALVLVTFFLLLYMVMQRTIQSSERASHS
ncbi:MAG: ABC transporter permease [Verrucomicrobia bacterium]|nr:ABC transporter permease [Verrucomicrobiota bacterium]